MELALRLAGPVTSAGREQETCRVGALAIRARCLGEARLAEELMLAAAVALLGPGVEPGEARRGARAVEDVGDELDAALSAEASRGLCQEAEQARALAGVDLAVAEYAQGLAQAHGHERVAGGRDRSSTQPRTMGRR